MVRRTPVMVVVVLGAMEICFSGLQIRILLSALPVGISLSKLPSFFLFSFFFLLFCGGFYNFRVALLDRIPELEQIWGESE